ncbi:RHS repeat-associated core domain-containing protein [Kitasatospora fiedleri]|uniref:RHS repeat-associated core domain-containing protein n=1 Tax=Kitasatospora fiedleri TaxID=2991545 RepID=UPI00249C3AD9|nr:RHS repeat-associated core domain-containing protein [Kitasatospora fiedleri]
MSNQIVKALEHGAQKLGKTLAEDAGKALKGFYRKAGDNLKKVAKNVRDVEEKHVKDLEKILKGEGKDGLPHPRSGGGRRGKDGTSHPGGRGREQVRSPRTEGRPLDTRCGGGEPVDMATGRMYIDQVDASLPGSLPLRFTRGFDSGLRTGRWMGPRWICTFDERLEIDEHGVVHVRPDRITQAYPHPGPGDPVHASAGSRHELGLVHGRFTVTDPATGLVKTFTPTPDGDEALLTEVRDRHGRHYALAYDPDGVPLSITHSGGYRLLVTVDNDRITALRLAGAGDNGGDALLTRYSYTDGHLAAAYNSSGKPMRFTNDATGRLTSWTDRNGSQYVYRYDSLDRVVDEGGTTGALRFTFTYGDPDPATGLRTHTETNALGHTTTYTVNDHAQITAVTDPLGHTTRYERDDHDRLLAETDPLGRTTRYEYDGAGDLTAVTRPDGGRSTAQYADLLGLPVTITEPGGATWYQAYDENGLRTALTSPLGATTTYAYDGLGHLAGTTDALGHTTRVRCDPAGLPVEVTDPTGAVIRYDRDAFGRVVAITDPLGGTVRSRWTVEGDLAERTRPDGSTERWTYDGEGNALTHTDQLGLTTAFEYTHFETLAARTTPDGARVAFTHDADMRLIAVTDGLGRTWHYDYDAAGRLTGERDYQGRTLTYRLDAVGQVTAVTDSLGTVTAYSYDLTGHLVRKNAGGRETAYAYNGSGHLVRAENTDATVVRTVDALGNLMEETVNGRTLRITRDVLGRRTGRTTPTGRSGTWTYDGAGRATALDTPDGSITFGYDPAGRETHRTFDRRLVLTSEWDSRHRMTGQSARTADRTLQQRGYGYRADSSLVTVEDLWGGPRAFDLDPVGRVTAVRGTEWEESYAYDPAGNVTRASWPATDTTRSAVGERTYSGTLISTAGRTAFEYDAAGRTTVRRVTRLSRKPDAWHYTWDAEDRLTEVTTPDGSRWQYRYDPFGRRIAKERTATSGSAGERTDFTWDGPVLAEQTTSAPYLPGPHTLSWEHHGIRPLTQTETISTAERVDRRFFAIVTDLIGTPTELIDPAAESIAWRATPTLWGQTTWPSDSTTYTPLRFPGQYFDPETRLHYNVHRYYNPETARYLTPDPLGLIPGPNPDAYVANPHTWCDPLGLSPHQGHQGPPRGEHSNPFDSREEAERAAFDLAGVPYGEEPIAEWKVVGDKRYRNMPGHVYSEDPTHWGNFRQFETENGSRVVVEHTHDPAGLHFHAGKPKYDDTRELVNFGWDNSPEGYTRMERYGKMNKPGGDHHFFYRRK